MSACGPGAGRGEGAPAAALPDPSALERPIMLWREGQHAASLRALEEAPWADVRVDFTLPVLTMTEAEFMALAPAENDPLSREAVALTQDLRALARAAVEESRRLSSAGEHTAADRLLGALGSLADRLALKDRRLAIIAAIGERMQTLVRQERARQPGRPSRDGG